MTTARIQGIAATLIVVGMAYDWHWSITLTSLAVALCCWAKLD